MKYKQSLWYFYHGLFVSEGIQLPLPVHKALSGDS